MDVSACLGLYMYVKTSKYRGDSLAVVVAAILLIWLLALAVLQRCTNCELSLRRKIPSVPMDCRKWGGSHTLDIWTGEQNVRGEQPSSDARNSSSRFNSDFQ